MKDILITDDESLAMIYSICGDEPDSVKYTIRLLWYIHLDAINDSEAETLKATRDEYLNGEKEIVVVK